MDRELRRQQRLAMRGVPERLGMQFAHRAADRDAGEAERHRGRVATSSGAATRPSTTPSSTCGIRGASRTPSTSRRARAKRSLANPNLDVPFLIGHNDAGIPLARTKSGTMKLAEDTHGAARHVPAMDGRREEVRALASAVERGDMDEMSLAFMCQAAGVGRGFRAPRRPGNGPAPRRRVRGGPRGEPGDRGCVDVPGRAAVVPPPGGDRRTRPARPRAAAADAPYSRGADEHVTCPACQSGNDADARFCDQCGYGLQALMDYVPHRATPSGTTTASRGTRRTRRSATSAGAAWSTTTTPATPATSYMSDYWSARRPPSDEPPCHGRTSTTCPTRRSPTSSPADRRTPRARPRRRGPRGTRITATGRPPRRLSAAAPRRWASIWPRRRGHRSTASTLRAGRWSGRASAAEDMNLTAAPDYNAAPVAAGLTCPQCQAGNHGGAKFCNQCGHGFATGATVTVDDSTGIPGEEVQMAAAARHWSWCLRELELEELAARRYSAA